MNWEAIGAIGEVAGAIAVVATLLYLGRQIRISSKAQQTATQHNILEEFRASITELIRDDRLSEAHARFSTGQDLDKESRLRIQMFISNQFRIYEELFLAYQTGSVDDEMWESRCQTMRELYLRKELTRTWWRKSGNAIYSRSFVNPVNQMIVDLEASEG